MNFSDLSSVEKYTLPESKYKGMSDTVLSWKKTQNLGRFDPNALSPEDKVKQQALKDEQEMQTRCRSTVQPGLSRALFDIPRYSS